MELDWVVARMRLHFQYRNCSLTAAFASASVGLLLAAGCDSHPPAQVASAAIAETPTSAKPAPVPSPAQPSDGPIAGSFTTTGPLVAEQQADIAAERNGRVVNIAVQIGDRVKRGQLLASLDDRLLRSACEAQKAHIASAQAEVRNWDAEESSARADLRRADVLRAEKILSEENWETAKYKVDQTVAEVARYKSEQAAAEAELSSANLQLEQSRIVAPFTGVVGRSSVRPSQEVKAGDVLFWVTAEAPLRVLFTVPETAMSAFSVGKSLELTTADYPTLHQSGRILRVSPVVDPASGSVQVIGAVVHPSPMLKPGMSMQVRLAP